MLNYLVHAIVYPYLALKVRTKTVMLIINFNAPSALSTVRASESSKVVSTFGSRNGAFPNGCWTVFRNLLYEN
jgi:hypothetical protein